MKKTKVDTTLYLKIVTVALSQKYNLDIKSARKMVNQSPLIKCLEFYPEFTAHEPVEAWIDDIFLNYY